MRIPKTFALGFIIMCLFSTLVGTLNHPTTLQIQNEVPDPKIAANCASNNTFPAIDQQLYANTPYNFSTQVRDETNFARTWDSANLLVQQSDQVAYRNTSLVGLGTYDAAYSFANDRSGGLAEGWGFVTVAATSAQVIDTYLGHRKVMQLYDNGAGAGDYVYAYNDFAAQTAGTVSFWFCFTPITCQYIRFALQNTAGNIGPGILFGGSLVSVYNGGWVTILTPSGNRWYHFNITFTAGATRTYNVDIDGVRVATGTPFQSAAATDITRCTFYTDGAGTTNFYGWFDAVDYSWTAGYDTSRSRNAIDLGQVGIYNATRSWEEETMFAVPAGFTASEAQAGNSRVYPAVPTTSYHHNILRMTSAGATNTNLFTESMPAITCASGGAVEFWGMWLSFGGSASSSVIYIGNSAESWKCILTVPNTGIMEATGNGMTYTTTLSLNTWYHFRFMFDATTFSFYLNGMLRASRFDDFTSPATVEQIYFHAYLDSVYHIDAVDWSSDPIYYPERSTFLSCNATQSFAVPGAYASKWQVWSAGVVFDAPLVPFTVIDPPVPTYPPYVGINYISALTLEYPDVEVFTPDGATRYYLAEYDMAISLTSEYANDAQEYIVRPDNITNLWIYKGTGAAESVGTWYPGKYDEGGGDIPHFEADPVVAVPGTIFHIMLRVAYPMASGSLNFLVYPLGNSSGGRVFSFGANQFIMGAVSWAIHGNILGDLNENVLLGTATMFPMARTFISREWRSSAYGPLFYYAITAGQVSNSYSLIEEFAIGYTAPSYWFPNVGPLIENRLFTINLTAGGMKVDPTAFVIGVQLYNSVQFLLWNQTGNQFILPIPVYHNILLLDTFNVLVYADSVLISNTSASLSTPGITVSLPSIYTTRTVYFAAFSNDALGIPQDSIRLYVNGTRKAWGPVSLTGSWVNVTVLDYVDDSQYSNVLQISDTTEINIFINIATMVLTNQMRNESIAITIRKDGTLLQNQSIGMGNALIFRFTNGNYTVQCQFQNGTIETRAVEVLAISTDLKTYTLDFGFFRDEAPLDLTDVEQSWVAWIFFGFAVIAFSIIIGIYTVRVRSKLGREERENKLRRRSTNGMVSDTKVK